MVILALPQSAILVLQRVNKEWQSIVDTTPAIQQKLFLQPSTDTIIWEGYSPFSKSTTVDLCLHHDWLVVSILTLSQRLEHRGSIR